MLLSEFESTVWFHVPDSSPALLYRKIIEKYYIVIFPNSIFAQMDCRLGFGPKVATKNTQKKNKKAIPVNLH